MPFDNLPDLDAASEALWKRYTILINRNKMPVLSKRALEQYPELSDVSGSGIFAESLVKASLSAKDILVLETNRFFESLSGYLPDGVGRVLFAGCPVGAIEAMEIFLSESNRVSRTPLEFRKYFDETINSLMSPPSEEEEEDDRDYIVENMRDVLCRMAGNTFLPAPSDDNIAGMKLIFARFMAYIDRAGSQELLDKLKVNFRLVYNTFKKYEAEGKCVVIPCKKSTIIDRDGVDYFILMKEQDKTSKFNSLVNTISRKIGWSAEQVKNTLGRFKDFNESHYTVGRNVVISPKMKTEVPEDSVFLPLGVDYRTEQIVFGLLFFRQGKQLWVRYVATTSVYDLQNRHTVTIHKIFHKGYASLGHTKTKWSGPVMQMKFEGINFSFMPDEAIINEDGVERINLGVFLKKPVSIIEKFWKNNEFNLYDAFHAKYPGNLSRRIFNTVHASKMKPKVSINKRIIKIMDPECRRLMLCSRIASLNFYNWIASDEKGWRTQAVKAYPVFSHIMFEYDSLRKKIDSGISYTQELADILGMTESNLTDFYGKFYQKYPFWKMTRSRHHDGDSNDVRPYDDILMNMGCRISNDSKKLSFLFKHLSKIHTDVFAKKFEHIIFAHHYKDFLDAERFLKKEDNITHYFDFLNEVRQGLILCLNSKDVVNKLNDIMTIYDEKFVGISFAHDIKNRLKSLFLFSMATAYSRMAKASLTSNERIEMRSNALVRYTGHQEVSWPALCEPYQHSLGTLTFITTAKGLNDEGKVMQHCVGGHSRMCFKSNYHIAHVSPNNHQYNKGSTVSISVTKTENDDGALVYRLKIGQHMLYADKRASGDHAKIVADFIGDVHSGKIEVDFPYLDEECVRRQTIEMGNTRPITLEEAEGVFDVYKDFLPKKFHQKTLMQAIEHHIPAFTRIVDDYIAHCRENSNKKSVSLFDEDCV